MKSKKNQGLSQKELEDKIQYYQNKYYNGEEEIDDSEFDKLWDELIYRFPESELLNQVEQNLNTSLSNKVKHNMLMGSQNKVNTVEGFTIWASKHPGPYYVDYKLDGISLELQYKQGKLIEALTRGDGFYGESILRAVQFMKGVPKTLNITDGNEISIRGEILINKKTFNEKYNEFKNPRNFVAGAVKNQNYNEEIYKDFDVICYDVSGYTSELRVKDFLTTNHFNSVPTILCNKINEVIEYRNSVDQKGWDFNIDGLVVKCLNRTKENYFSKIRPLNQIAFKWEDSTKQTVVRDVEWSISGQNFTPIAIFDSINLEGSTVCRASLSNYGEIKRLGLKIGDTVEVCKRGMIIPHIERVINL